MVPPRAIGVKRAAFDLTAAFDGHILSIRKINVAVTFGCGLRIHRRFVDFRPDYDF